MALVTNSREGGCPDCDPTDTRVTLEHVDTQNITLALPRALLRKAQVVAARRENSVSALVTDALEDLVRANDEYEPAMQRALTRARAGYDLRFGRQIEGGAGRVA